MCLLVDGFIREEFSDIEYQVFEFYYLLPQRNQKKLEDIATHYYTKSSEKIDEVLDENNDAIYLQSEVPTDKDSVRAMVIKTRLTFLKVLAVHGKGNEIFEKMLSIHIVKEMPKLNKKVAKLLGKDAPSNDR